MELNTALQKLKEYERRGFALSHASGLMYYDGATTAPKGSAGVRAITLGELSRISYEHTTAKESIEMLECLMAHSDELDPVTRRKASELYRDYERTHRVPIEEFVAHQQLCSEADSVWHEAKVKDDFSMFEPYLQKMFDSTKRMALYMEPDKRPYDTMLDNFERGLTASACDAFFDTLKKRLVPLMHKVVEHGDRVNDAPLRQSFPIAKQKELSSYLMDVMGIDRDHCILGETEHPFTTDFSKYDVRITTHYYENNFAASLYSVIHEGGHALYELNINPDYDYTVVTHGATMGIHESQSRLFENLVGRSRAFVHYLYPTLKELFPAQLADVSAEEIWRAVNRAEPGLIRTEADELTYALHIMVRYELEKALMQGTLAVADLPAAWNAKYKEYLGVDVPDDAHGCLQDIHWSMGDIGYFPSYALGSAYGAQALDDLRKTNDFDAQWANGDVEPLKAALKERVWQWGSMKEPAWLVESLCGGKFDPHHFTDYLKKKYTELYEL